MVAPRRTLPCFWLWECRPRTFLLSTDRRPHAAGRHNASDGQACCQGSTQPHRLRLPHTRFALRCTGMRSKVRGSHL